MHALEVSILTEFVTAKQLISIHKANVLLDLQTAFNS